MDTTTILNDMRARLDAESALWDAVFQANLAYYLSAVVGIGLAAYLISRSRLSKTRPGKAFSFLLLMAAIQFVLVSACLLVGLAWNWLTSTDVLSAAIARATQTTGRDAAEVTALLASFVRNVELAPERLPLLPSNVADAFLLAGLVHVAILFVLFMLARPSVSEDASNFGALCAILASAAMALVFVAISSQDARSPLWDRVSAFERFATRNGPLAFHPAAGTDGIEPGRPGR